MKPKFLTAALAALLVIWLAARSQRTSAADGETITWGATDPTWSPDGRQLAFSLFGSIWQVDAAGGEAQQITVSPGYHAHPAWSPKGGQIAYISGRAPAGLLPNISGKLMLVDLASGRERELATPQPTGGTPAWSPDGTRLVCGLQVPNAGSLLHEIQAADGQVTQVQFRPQRGLAGFWTGASWAAAEIFFSASRRGAPKVWSMSASRPPIMVQLPLTSYRESDIVQIDSVAATPDGSAVIYSAVIVNGKGDRELYRVSRQGGAAVNLTNTPRDEFSPAVSPDGRHIAHVSNHMGNLDLFTMPIGGGAKQHVRITGLKFRAPSGRVRVKVLDELGQPTPVRLYVRASDARAYAPSGTQIFYYPLDPGPDRDGFFVGKGEDEFPVPAGPVRLTALKGVEYRILEKTVDVAAGQTAEVTLSMERWTNWAQRGWHTGENHFHANYNGSYYQRPPDSLRWLEAEDLNTANMIVANANGAFIHDKEFFRGGVDPISKPRYVLYWGQEFRNSDPLGHMAFLNIKKQVPPSYTTVIGSDSPYDFPLNTMAALEAKKQGGVVSYVHPMGGFGDVYDTGLGAKEAPLTAAVGGMDAIDILPFGDGARELWYRLLNCGFHIAPGAGTDVFTNWRGINNIPGGSRQYVEVGGAMNWDRWIARYKEGRAFVTSGPLVSFTANGQAVGSVIRIPEGQPYTVKLVGEVTSRMPINGGAFIQNGVDFERRNADPGATTLRMEKEVTIDRSTWFSFRTGGPPARGVAGGPPRAHSGAIYFEAGGKPAIVREDVELMIRSLNRLWVDLEERNNIGSPANKKIARALFDQGLAHYRGKLQ